MAQSGVDFNGGTHAKNSGLVQQGDSAAFYRPGAGEVRR
jgi:hypothetical protein